MVFYQKIAKKIAAQATQFEVVDGVLCFIDLKQRNKKRVVVPSHLKGKLIQEVHGGTFSGHFATSQQVVCSAPYLELGGGMECIGM